MTYRRVAMKDSERLLRWRNDPGTIRGLPFPRITSEDEHVVWLEKRLGSPWPFQIAELDGVPVGVVRYDPRMECSIIVAPEHRGHGYAASMIQDTCVNALFPPVVWARVMPGNSAARRAFEQSGFVQLPTVCLYERKV